MKIKKSYLKSIIKNYLNESLNEDEGNWLDDKDDSVEKDTEEFGEEAKIKDINQYAAEVLENYKIKQLKRLRDQLTKENNPYLHIAIAAEAINQTSHVFVESIPDFANDDHEQIGTAGTIAIFRYAHKWIDNLKPVGEESIANYKNAINALNTIKDEKNVKDAYSKVIPLVILNYPDLSSRRKDTDDKNNAVESVTKHEFDHIKSFVLNSFLKDEGKRINIDVLKTIIRDDLKDKSESEINSILTQENEGRIEDQLLGQITRQVYPYYKDIFDETYTVTPGQADEISARLHQLNDSGYAKEILKNYQTKKKPLFPLKLTEKYKLQQNIKEILPFLKKDLTYEQLRGALDKLAKLDMPNQKTEVPT